MTNNMSMEDSICQIYGLRKVRILSKCFMGKKRGYHENNVIFVICFAFRFSLYWIYQTPKEEE